MIDARLMLRVVPVVLACGCAAAQPGGSSAEAARDAAAQPDEDREPRRIQGPPRGPGAGVLVTLEADAAHQFKTGIDATDGGKVATSLVATRLSARIPVNRRTGLSLSAGTGLLRYEFSGPSGIIPGSEAPWEDIVVSSVGLGASYAINERWRLFGGLNVSSAGEPGADFGDTLTYGGSVGVAYTVSETLTVGTGVTVQTRLEESVFVLPFPTFEWVLPGDPQQRWRLIVGGSRIGPSRAAGAVVTYAASERLTLIGGWAGFGLGGDFRLDDDGPVPGGVGRDRSFPILLGADWRPNRKVRLSAYAGAALFGELEIYDGEGNRVAKRRVDPTMTLGLGLSVSF